MFSALLKINITDRPWHVPVIAGLLVGIPLIYGFYSGNIVASKTAAFGALVILYLQSNDLTTRIKRLAICGLLFIISFAIGLLFSNNIWLGALMLGVWSVIIHYGINRYNLYRPPGNFFFIMIAAIGVANPVEFSQIPNKLAYLTIGVVISVVLGSLYSWVVLSKQKNKPDKIILPKDLYVNFTESLIYGVVIGASLLIAQLLKLENAYWVPTSCLAVMQTVSSKHVWTKFAQRVLGTIIGLVLIALLLQLDWSPWGICILMICLQIIVEFFIVRNYGIAAIFITMMTILLVESNVDLLNNSYSLFVNRLVDIVLGSIVGVIGGLLLYHEKLHFISKMQIKKSKVIFHKFLK